MMEVGNKKQKYVDEAPQARVAVSRMATPIEPRRQRTIGDSSVGCSLGGAAWCVPSRPGMALIDSGIARSRGPGSSAQQAVPTPMGEGCRIDHDETSLVS